MTDDNFNSALKAIAVLSSSILYQAPAFALQATPQNIVGLSDLLYNYMTNKVQVTAPETKDEAEAPKFA